MELGNKVKINSSGIIGVITCIRIEFGSKVLFLSKEGKTLYNGSYSGWNESQVQLIK